VWVAEYSGDQTDDPGTRSTTSEGEDESREGGRRGLIRALERLNIAVTPVYGALTAVAAVALVVAALSGWI
jgi:hypothetical protein